MKVEISLEVTNLTQLEIWLWLQAVAASQPAVKSIQCQFPDDPAMPF